MILRTRPLALFVAPTRCTPALARRARALFCHKERWLQQRAGCTPRSALAAWLTRSHQASPEARLGVLRSGVVWIPLRPTGISAMLQARRGLASALALLFTP